VGVYLQESGVADHEGLAAGSDQIIRRCSDGGQGRWVGVVDIDGRGLWGQGEGEGEGGTCP